MAAFVLYILESNMVGYFYEPLRLYARILLERNSSTMHAMYIICKEARRCAEKQTNHCECKLCCIGVKRKYRAKLLATSSVYCFRQRAPSLNISLSAEFTVPFTKHTYDVSNLSLFRGFLVANFCLLASSCSYFCTLSSEYFVSTFLSM